MMYVKKLEWLKCRMGQLQGSQRHGKSWKTWKMKKAFSRPGKIMEFNKKAKIMEKSWNFKIPLWKNHGIFLSPPVRMHGGLLCIAFCLSVCLSVWM